MDKKLEILRKYNAYEFFDDGRFIDAQDTVNAWCLGQIVAVDNKNLNIHFDGWSNRWDIVSTLIELIDFNIFIVAKGYLIQNITI